MSDPRFIQKGFDKCLSHVIEECGEVLSAAGKLQRHGKYSVNPLLPELEQEMNIYWLMRELVDLKQAIERLETEIDLELDTYGTIVRAAAEIGKAEK